MRATQKKTKKHVDLKSGNNTRTLNFFTRPTWMPSEKAFVLSCLIKVDTELSDFGSSIFFYGYEREKTLVIPLKYIKYGLKNKISLCSNCSFLVIMRVLNGCYRTCYKVFYQNMEIKNHKGRLYFSKTYSVIFAL